MARDRRSGQGVPWVQVMPEGWQARVPPWYDTTSGMFEAPPGNAVALRLRRGPDNAACGALMTRHDDYSEFAEIARRIQVPAGVFLIRAEIHPQDRVFSLDGLAPHPLSELPGIPREQYGLTAGQDIMLVPVYTAGLIHYGWAQLPDDYDAIARAEGVNVYFPAFRSDVQFLPGDWAPAVYSTNLAWSAEGTWEHRGGQGARRRLAQDGA